MVIDGDELSYEDLKNLSPAERQRVIVLCRGRMRDCSIDIGYYGAQWSGEHYKLVAYRAAELQCAISVLLAVGFDPYVDNG